MASIASPSHRVSPLLPVPALSWSSTPVLPPTLVLARSSAIRISCRSVESAYGFHFGNSNWRIAYRSVEDDDLEGEGRDFSFDQAVFLFNSGDYYACHDVLEAIWSDAQEPIRTIVHGILQCAVGFHHLFNQNHRGAMMELGEGLCKLRKMNFSSGPFYQFEQEISAVQNFIYKTQLELAACADDSSLTMDQLKRSYQPLGILGARSEIYVLEGDADGTFYVSFDPMGLYNSSTPRVKVPVLKATKAHLDAWERE